jgi:hypothetical protein
MIRDPEPYGCRVFAFGDPTMTTLNVERQAPSLPRFISMTDLRKKVLGGVAASTVRDMIADGLLPEPLRPRHNLALFDEAAVSAAIAQWPRSHLVGWRRGATA